MAFQAAGNVGAPDHQSGQVNTPTVAATADLVNCPSPNSCNNITPTNSFMDLSLNAMVPGRLNPKVSNLMNSGVRENAYNQNIATLKVGNGGQAGSGGSSSGVGAASTTESALQFIAALQQAQSLSALAAAGYSHSANPHLIEPSKFFYNLVASQYPSQVYGGGGGSSQPLLTSFFNSMINNSLNVPTGAPPARVSTPPSNPASMTSSSGHDVTGSVGNTTTTSSRGDTAAISMSSGGVGGTYNANAYFQTAASAAAADASIFPKNMGDVADYSNPMFNESLAASATMNNSHIRLNNSAPPFEGSRNNSSSTVHSQNHLLSEAHSKGSSPVQSEEWNRNNLKKKVKRNENVNGSAHKKYNNNNSLACSTGSGSSNSAQARSKKGTFCVVTPDEVGSSSYHCTELSHPISVQIWNPTNVPVLIKTSIQKLTMVVDSKSGSTSSSPIVESPFSIEGSFMLDAQNKDYLKIVFRSKTAGTYHADLNIEATPVHSVSADKPKLSFIKTIKLTASATDVMIAKYIRNLDGSFEQLGDQYELGNMKPGSTHRTDILFENRSQALATLLVNFHQDRGSTVTVVALNGVELSNPLSKLSFDTHGYVDLGAHINYHTVCMTIEVFIPTTWRDTKAQLQFALYATVSAGDSKAPVRFLHSTTFNLSVVQPKLYIPPHAQHIELHEQALTQNVPVRNCSSKQLQLTLRCNNSAFIVNPVELELQPYTVVPIAITFDQRCKREQASVIITVEPEGPVYTVNVDGKGLDEDNPALTSIGPSTSSGKLGTSSSSKHICTCQKPRQTTDVSSTPVASDDTNSLNQSEVLKDNSNEDNELLEEVGPNNSAALVEVMKPEKMMGQIEKHRERRMDLKSKIVLSSVEYLFFTGGSASKPEQLTCLLKNNSSYFAKWKFSISQATRLFSVAEVCRRFNEEEGDDLNGAPEGITVAPQEVLRVSVQFQCANSKLDFLTGFLIISPTYNDSFSLDEDTAAIQNSGFPAENNLDHAAPTSSRQMMLPSYFDASRDMEDSKHKSPDFRLPLYAYTGSCFIKATVKQYANLKWNTPAIVSVRNTGERFAYVVVTSSHASDATPSYFSLPPNGETLISKLFCKPDNDGTILEVTWGDAILKHVYDHFSAGMCLQTSKQIHAFLVSPFQMSDAHNHHGDKLPKREFCLNPQLLTKNIYSTLLCLTVDSKKPCKINSSSLSLETPCSFSENPSVVSFDKPTEADFPRLVASPLGESDRNGNSGKGKSRSDGKPWCTSPQTLVMEFGNASYQEKKNGFVKIVGAIAVTNNSSELTLGCEISSANEKLKLSSNYVKLDHKESRDISVEAIVKSDLMTSCSNNSGIEGTPGGDKTLFDEVLFKLMFEDREMRLRPPIFDKTAVFLPGSKHMMTKQTRGGEVGSSSLHARKILDADFEESSYLSQCWQVQFPQTKNGDWANACLTFTNLTNGKLKWTLTTMCHPFISVTSNPNSPVPKAQPAVTTAPVEPEFSKPTGPFLTLFKVKQQVFRFERTSGFLDCGATAAIRAEFAPSESGSFIQHWELSFQKRVATESEKACRVQRIYLKGSSFGWGRFKGVRDSSPKTRMERIDFISDLPSELREKFTVFVTESIIRFEETPCGATDRKFLFIRNSDAAKQHQVKFLNPEPPFVMNHGGYEIGTRRILKVPVVFKPTSPGTYSSFFIIITDSPSKSVIPTFLHGVAVKPKSKTLAEPTAALSSEQTILESPTSCDTTNDGDIASRIKSHSEESFDEFIKYTEEAQSLVFANSSTVTSSWLSSSFQRHLSNEDGSERSLHAKQGCTSSTIVETQYMPPSTSKSTFVQSTPVSGSGTAFEDNMCVECDLPQQLPSVEELQDSLPNQDTGHASASVVQLGPAPSVAVSSTVVGQVAINRDEIGVAEHISDTKK